MKKDGPSFGLDPEAISILRRWIPFIPATFQDDGECIFTVNAHDRNILSPPLMKILLRLCTLRGRGFPSPRAGEGRGGGCIFTVINKWNGFAQKNL